MHVTYNTYLARFLTGHRRSDRKGQLLARTGVGPWVRWRAPELAPDGTWQPTTRWWAPSQPGWACRLGPFAVFAPPDYRLQRRAAKDLRISELPRGARRASGIGAPFGRPSPREVLKAAGSVNGALRKIWQDDEMQRRREAERQMV